MSDDPTEDGCELCGDFPTHLHSRCHPTAPLRIELHEDNLLVMFCYVPTCNREVWRCKVKDMRH